jgi:thiamine phosphate synthase YjbQ (UPF0047 family)
MASPPVEVNLDLHPTQRFELIDVTRMVREQVGDVFGQFRRSVFCSLHTTAGYLEQGMSARLGHSPRQLGPFIRLFQRIFPPGAGYSHDRIDLRTELSEQERQQEPTNADSHLTFIGAGLRSCVTYINQPRHPVYFIELDGVYRNQRRQRRTTVIAYDSEDIVCRQRVGIPVPSRHVIDSVNLKDTRLQLFERIEALLGEHGIRRGRVDIRLAPEERHAGLTVNEYETLLMRNDLPEVLRDPLRYMVQRGKHLLRNPGAIAGKTRDYATYDLIHLYNEVMDTVPIGRAVVDRVMSALSSPASRALRLKRTISLLVSDGGSGGTGRVLQGTYQSPILVQHQPAAGSTRYLDIVIRRFND